VRDTANGGVGGTTNNQCASNVVTATTDVTTAGVDTRFGDVGATEILIGSARADHCPRCRRATGVGANTGEDLIVRTGVEAAQGGCHTATESAPGYSGAASGSHCAPIRVYRHRAAVDRHRRPADGARG